MVTFPCSKLKINLWGIEWFAADVTLHTGTSPQNTQWIIFMTRWSLSHSPLLFSLLSLLFPSPPLFSPLLPSLLYSSSPLKKKTCRKARSFEEDGRRSRRRNRCRSFTDPTSWHLHPPSIATERSKYQSEAGVTNCDRRIAHTIVVCRQTATHFPEQTSLLQFRVFFCSMNDGFIQNTKSLAYFAVLRNYSPALKPPS